MFDETPSHERNPVVDVFDELRDAEHYLSCNAVAERTEKNHDTARRALETLHYVGVVDTVETSGTMYFQITGDADAS